MLTRSLIFLTKWSVFVQQEGAILTFCTEESWIVLSQVEQSIKHKVEQKGVPLKEWGLSINRGILTGFNDAFIISGTQKDDLIASDPKSAELIRPILRGRDIKRYEVNYADLWLINVHNGLKSENLSPINITDYPAIKKHLDQYYDKLAKRADKGETPYNLRNCAYMNDFSKQKIVWGNLCLSAQFSLAEEGTYINAPSPMIVPGNKYLLAVLNSKLGDWYIRQLGVTRNGGYFEYKPMFVEKLPIPIIDDTEQQRFIEMVDTLLTLKNANASTEEIEHQIDTCVYELYGLTPDEIAFIEE